MTAAERSQRLVGHFEAIGAEFERQASLLPWWRWRERGDLEYTAAMARRIAEREKKKMAHE